MRECVAFPHIFVYLFEMCSKKIQFYLFYLVNSGLKLIWSELLNLVNKPNNGNAMNAAFHMHQRTCNGASDSSSDSDDSCEMYLMRILTNPLSLKQQARIVIRNRMIENMKSHEFVQKFVLSHPKYQLNSAFESKNQNANTSIANASSRRIHTTATEITATHQTNSILECLIWQLDLPRCLHFYLYAFSDIPPTPQTQTQHVAVFVND